MRHVSRSRLAHRKQRLGAAVLAATLLCVLASLSRAVTPPSEVDALKAGSIKEGFEQAREPRAFQFPLDHGPHETFRHEWWYVTGQLQSKTGERFGFELTFFRLAIAPPGSEPQVASGETSRWRTRQMYMAHFAVTDVSRRQFRFAERYARGALGLAGAQAAPFRVWLEDWSLGEEQSAGRQWQLHAAEDKYALTLNVQPLLAPVLNGEQGLSRKSMASGTASYYYSIPRMAVHGEIVRDGKAIAVDGLAWLDREWGSSSLAEVDEGWDWFALQLDDGSALMFYEFRNRTGTRDPNSAGTWVAPDGSAHRLKSEDVKIEVRDYWTSPRGGRYPARWRVLVPSLNLDIDVKPVLADQELNTSTRYWEGAVDVVGTSDQQRPVRGRGYVELVGYAR